MAAKFDWNVVSLKCPKASCIVSRTRSCLENGINLEINQFLSELWVCLCSLTTRTCQPKGCTFVAPTTSSRYSGWVWRLWCGPYRSQPMEHYSLPDISPPVQQSSTLVKPVSVKRRINLTGPELWRSVQILFGYASDYGEPLRLIWVFPSHLLFAFKVLMELFAEEKGQNNLAFAILLQLGYSTACVDLLTKTQRAPEAALFARTYAPRFIFFISRYLNHLIFCLSRSYVIHSSQASKAVQAWKSELTSKKRTKVAATIADSSSNPELFEEGWEEMLAREEIHSNGTFYCCFKAGKWCYYLTLFFYSVCRCSLEIFLFVH